LIDSHSKFVTVVGLKKTTMMPIPVRRRSAMIRPFL